MIEDTLKERKVVWGLETIFLENLSNEYVHIQWDVGHFVVLSVKTCFDIVHKWQLGLTFFPFLQVYFNFMSPVFS